MRNWHHLMPIAYCNSIEVLNLTDKLCRKVIANNISGDFAECGVAAGAHCIIMNEIAAGRKVYLFDSFEGIPQHTEEDKEWVEAHGIGGGDVRKSSGITSVSLNNVRNNIAGRGDISNCVFVKGWFADTLPTQHGMQLSILRLDCDLYESYKECLKWLLPRVVTGGYVIIDDYSLSGCRQALSEAGITNVETINNNTVAYFKV